MRHVGFLLRALLSAFLIWLLLRHVRWLEVWAVLRDLDGRLILAAFAVAPLLVLALAARWRFFLRLRSIALPWAQCIYLTWVGQFFNLCLPGSIGGDMVKILGMCRRAPDRKAAAAATVLADRISALAGLLLLVFFSLAAGMALPDGASGSGKLKRWAWCGLAFLLMAAAGTGWGLRWWTRRGSPGKIKAFVASVFQCFPHPGLFAGAVFASAAIHGLNFFALFLIANAVGIGVEFRQFLMIQPLILLVSLVPVTVNGYGIREILYVYAFQSQQVSLGGHVSGMASAVAAFSLVLVLFDLCANLPAGMAYLLREKSGISARMKEA